MSSQEFVQLSFSLLLLVSSKFSKNYFCLKIWFRLVQQNSLILGAAYRTMTKMTTSIRSKRRLTSFSALDTQLLSSSLTSYTGQFIKMSQESSHTCWQLQKKLPSFIISSKLRIKICFTFFSHLQLHLNKISKLCFITIKKLRDEKKDYSSLFSLFNIFLKN